MYIRLTKTVKDKGQLLLPEEAPDVIGGDEETDWYYSPFQYGEDALKYFEENNKSIKGFTGKAFTDTLYWDFDCKDVSLAQEAAKRIVKLLIEDGLEDGIEIYFSGNKGFHVLLNTLGHFSPKETSKVCYNTAISCDIQSLAPKIFDTSVYNINRIFRVENTKHPESKLFKVALTVEELFTLTEVEIKNLAKAPRNVAIESIKVNAEFLKEKYKGLEEETSSQADLALVQTLEETEFNPMDCPPNKRRCIYVLENGYFGPGERENALIRLAANYKGQGWSKDIVKKHLNDALEKRTSVYADLNPYKDADTKRVVDLVFSEGWNGGTYSCKSDHFLQSKCDLGEGPCSQQDSSKNTSIVTIGGLIDIYKEYGKEAQEEYPKTGVEWLDSLVRLRPKNVSVLNGANGSSKTSIVMQIIENLNKQKMYNVFFSADMANVSLLEKLGAKYTTYTVEQIESAFNIHTEDKSIQLEMESALKKHLPYTFFDFTSALTSKHIETALFNLNQEGFKVQMAFVDYAGRLLGDADNSYANATKQALESNDIAKRTNTHLMYLSQIPREWGDHTRPVRSSRASKDSGAWEENATIVLNIWRPFGDGITGNDHYLHMYIAKNRSGQHGERAFLWNGKTGTISEMDQREFDQYYKLCELEGKDMPFDQFKAAEPYRPAQQEPWNNDQYEEDEEYGYESKFRPSDNNKSRNLRRGASLYKR